MESIKIINRWQISSTFCKSTLDCLNFIYVVDGVWWPNASAVSSKGRKFVINALVRIAEFFLSKKLKSLQLRRLKYEYDLVMCFIICHGDIDVDANSVFMFLCNSVKVYCPPAMSGFYSLLIIHHFYLTSKHFSSKNPQQIMLSLCCKLVE